MLKYEFDQEKKDRFLSFWKLERTDEYALLENDLLLFAFKFAGVFSFNERVAKVFKNIMQSAMTDKYLVFKNNTLQRSSVNLLSVAIDKTCDEVIFLEDINIFSWIKDRKHLSIGTDFLQLSPLFLKYVGEVDYIPTHTKDEIRNAVEVDRSNILFLKGINNSNDLKKGLEKKPWTKLDKSTKTFLYKIYELQAIDFSKLSQEVHERDIAKLLKMELVCLGRKGDECVPILLFNNAALQNRNLWNWLENKKQEIEKDNTTFEKHASNVQPVLLEENEGEQKDEGTVNHDEREEVISEEKLADKVFLEPQRQLKRFVEIFVTAQLMVTKKYILTAIPETYGKEVSKSREDFIKKYIIGNLVRNSADDNFITLSLKKKCCMYMLSGVGKYANLFLDFCFLVSLNAEGCNDVFSSNDEVNIDLQNASLLKVTRSVNRLRIYLGKKTFSIKVYKKLFWLLGRMSVTSFIAGKLCFNKNAVLFLYSAILESYSKESWRYDYNDEKCIIDSDMTVTAYRDALSLESVVFLSLFCKISATEHLLRFVPFANSATFSWYCGVGKKEALLKLEKLGGNTYSKHVADFFAVFFEHAKGVVSTVMPTLQFSSQHFFQSVKHLLQEAEMIKSEAIFEENQRCIFFLTKNAFLNAKELLQKKKMIKEI